MIKEIKVLKHEVVQFTKTIRMNSGTVSKHTTASQKGSKEHSTNERIRFYSILLYKDIIMNSEQQRLC